MDAPPLVVDANVVVYMLLDGEKSPAARRLHEMRPDWVCPTILRHEFMNVCATYQRAGGFSRRECLALLKTGLGLLSGREVDIDPEAAVGVALDLDLSAYDAQYVAVALALQGVLVTEDRLVLARAPAVARTLADFVDLE
ncbi:MAG: type II toxin-antitoxin system VapC family toxin [Actinobacteria bacterium]|nr:type II toxin-antitoxin system VapC family toxin [Actinomycetota bacterium]